MTKHQKERLRRKIGKNLTKLCEELYGPRGKRKMAKALKMSPGAFGDNANGKRSPSAYTIVTLARLLNKNKATTTSIFDVLGV